MTSFAIWNGARRSQARSIRRAVPHGAQPGVAIRLNPTTVATLPAVPSSGQERLLSPGLSRPGQRLRPDPPPAHPSRVRLDGLRPPVKRCGFPGSASTLALAAGVDVKIVSEMLGGASAKITWDIEQRVGCSHIPC